MLLNSFSEPIVQSWCLVLLTLGKFWALIEVLFDKNLIERVRCENDRRVVFVKISDAGLDALDEIDKEFKSDSANMFTANLTDEESDVLSDLLDKLRG